MSDEIEEEQESSRDEKGRGPAMQSIDTPDSDELNLFVLDMYEQFTKDSGHAITEFEFTNHDEYTESSSEQTNMERFIAMIKSSEKVPQVYREMSNDEVRSLVQQGLQSQKFVPIVPNAGDSAGRGAVSAIPYPVKPKVKKGSYRSWKEAMSQTGKAGHHGAFSRTVWKTASRNQKDAIVPFEEKALAVSPQVEESLQFIYEDKSSDKVEEEFTAQSTESKTGDDKKEGSLDSQRKGRPKEG